MASRDDADNYRAAADAAVVGSRLAAVAVATRSFGQHRKCPRTQVAVTVPLAKVGVVIQLVDVDD